MSIQECVTCQGVKRGLHPDTRDVPQLCRRAIANSGPHSRLDGGLCTCAV